jgi:phage shock protein C
MKRLYKSTLNRKICGVCGGVGEYFDIDPTLVRVIWVIAALCGTFGLWAYILCALIIPNDIEIK